MKHNRSRDGLVIALAFLQQGKKDHAVAAFSMLTAGEDIEEIVKDLDEKSEASAKALEAKTKKAEASAADKRILANLRKTLAGEDADEGTEDGEEEACNTTKAADAQDGPDVDEGSGELLTSDNPDVVTDDQVTAPEQLENAPSETVEASDDEDEDEGDEEEASVAVTAAAAKRLERSQRNMVILAKLKG